MKNERHFYNYPVHFNLPSWLSTLTKIIVSYRIITENSMCTLIS